jgi:hypothetical protein
MQGSAAIDVCGKELVIDLMYPNSNNGFPTFMSYLNT